MRDWVEGTLGMSFTLFVVGVVFIALCVIGGLVYYNLQGAVLTKQFQNVKHAQPFVETTNQSMRTLITDYAGAAAKYNEYAKSDQVTAKSYQGQMQSDLNQIYALAGSLDKSEIASDVQTFLDSHPNEIYK